MHRILFTLLLVLMPTQLGYHFWPEWALVLGRRVDYLSPTLYVTDILIFLMIVFWYVESRVGFKGFVSSIKQKKKKRYQGVLPLILNTKYVILFILLIVVNILSASSKPVAISKWLKVAELFLLGWYIVKTKPRIESLALPLAVGVLFSSTLAIIQFLLQRSVGGLMWWFGERTFMVDTPGIARIALKMRPYATFPHPNVLGGFLAVVLPLFLVQLHNKRSFFLIITIVLGLTALFLTFSRSAWVVGMAGMCITYFVLRRKRRKIFIPLLLNALFVILFTVFVLKGIDFKGESVVVRQQLNGAALSLWRRSPIVGIGLGNFLTELPKVLPSRTIYFLQPVHNIYLLFLAETGVVGLSFFGWLLWNALRGLIRDTRYRKRNQKNSLFVACRLSLVALLLLGFIDHYPVTLQQGQLLMTILIGLNLAGDRAI